MATPLISKELQASFRQAIADAKRMRHEYLTLEHLLLALTEEPKTQKILVACGADVKRLRQRLEKFLAETVERLPESVKAEPQQTIGIERVLQRAAIHALSAEQRVIEGGDVLVAMFREDESHALFLLQQEGITRLDLLNYLLQGLPRRQPTEVIATPDAPPAIGPYSQAIRAGDFVFVSGQVAVDVRTGKLAEGIEAQTRQVIENLGAVLAAVSASLDQVVKVTIFLARWEDFGAMNEVYARYFGTRPPARSVVQGPRIPEGTLIGLEAIAYLG